MHVRLVNGIANFQGRVEFYTSELGWGTVCDQDWSINEARVVCRQLGYPPATQAQRGAHFGRGTGQVHSEDFKCRGDESDISLCQTGSSWSDSVCDHADDVSVTCGEPGACARKGLSSAPMMILIIWSIPVRVPFGNDPSTRR